MVIQRKYYQIHCSNRSALHQNPWLFLIEAKFICNLRAYFTMNNGRKDVTIVLFIFFGILKVKNVIMNVS